MHHHSFSAFRKKLMLGQTTCEQEVTGFLQKIKEQKQLNAFLEVYEEESLIRAREADQRFKNGTFGKLTGMVVALKDNMCYKAHQVSASSRILENFHSLYHATVVERLLKEGAIIIGRCNCDEFAMGSSNEKSSFGPVLNPHDHTKVPGGSSGGSAVAVAAGLCHAALGTDTGGSIRQPASFTGVYGLKPTYGRVSRYGIIAYASSFDQVGPLTVNVADMAAIMEVISGRDEYDTTLSSVKVDEYSTGYEANASKKYRIAFISECLEKEGLNSEVKEQVSGWLEEMKRKGHTVEPVSFPYLDYLVPAYYILTTAEASSNLARYDGIHFGYRSPNASDLESTYKLSRSEGFGKEVKRRIMLGTFVLSEGYYDAYYNKAQQVRRIIKNKTEEILARYDFIVTPTTPGTAFAFGQNDADPVAMYLEDIFTVQANIAGLPALSIPLFKNSRGMPFGLQLIGKAFDELTMMQFANCLQQPIEK